jgi:lipid A disaccharide synthetase
MMAQGFVSHWPMETLSVNGYVEVLGSLREILATRREIREQLLARPPLCFIGVDAPDFNFGLEVPLRRAGIPVVHFVSPSIWAWRGGRIRTIARAVDHILCLFPFEPEIYAKAGIPATYVGHPLADVIPMVPDVAGAGRSWLCRKASGSWRCCLAVGSQRCATSARRSSPRWTVCIAWTATLLSCCLLPAHRCGDRCGLARSVSGYRPDRG